MIAALLTVVVLVVVIAVLVRAFRSGLDVEPGSREAEEAKRAKYRELREVELDWRTGKLSDADYAQTQNELRQEAAALLERTSGDQGGEHGVGSANGSAP